MLIHWYTYYFWLIPQPLGFDVKQTATHTHKKMSWTHSNLAPGTAATSTTLMPFPTTAVAKVNNFQHCMQLTDQNNEETHNYLECTVRWVKCLPCVVKPSKHSPMSEMSTLCGQAIKAQSDEWNVYLVWSSHQSTTVTVPVTATETDTKLYTTTQTGCNCASKATVLPVRSVTL